MKKEQQAYRSILKVTALFGGVQVFQVLLSLIRTKIIAVLLGVNGVGLLGLLNNTLALLSTTTRLGVDQGAIREIAISQQEGRIAQLATIVHRWSFFVGLMGACITLSLAPQLSKWSFGNEQYTWAYSWLACTLLFDALTRGKLALFQGLRKFKTLAKANLIGASIALLLSLPIYLLWGEKGIVPALLVTYICTFLCTYWFYRKEKIEHAPVTLQTTIQQGGAMMQIGVMLTISGFAATLCSYLITIYLSNYGQGLEEVGLYQAGFNLIEKYVGLIFVAMSTDYYPRLSAVNENNVQLKEMVNQQVIVSLLIICPIICIFLPTAPIIVHLLLSKEFLPIIPFLLWAILGVFFKVISNSLGYVFIAKKAVGIFIVTDLLSYSTIVITSLVGYYLWGLKGIGMAYLLSYALYFIQVYWIAKKRYQINFSTELIRLSFIVALLCVSNFLLMQYLQEQPLLRYSLSTVVILISLIYTWKELNKRIDLRQFFQKKHS
ncbi:MAG: oligosaccharide flippase family protein [Bacteroidaceae bacterium]|nr:oligosaccharide flippase family protein [Bacteroidaceae bacterium]